MEKIPSIIKNNKFYIAIILLSVLLLYLFIPTGDDINRIIDRDKGIAYILKGIEKSYLKLNGRLLGNLLSKLFIKPVTRTVVKFFLILSVLISLVRITGSQGKLAYPLGILALTTMTKEIFRETLVWNAGFYNYFPPLAMILGIIYWYIRREEAKASPIVLGFTAFASCLFIENMTIYLIALPLLLYFVFRDRRKIRELIAIQLGSLAGAALMFSSPVYRAIAQHQDEYRQVEENSIREILQNSWRVFDDLMLAKNTLVLLLFLAIFIYIIVKNKPGEKIFAWLALATLLAIKGLNLVESERTILLLASLGLHLSFYLTILLYGMKNYREDWAKLLIFFCLSMAISMGPILFVNPIGPRNFLTSTIFNLLIGLTMFKALGLEKFLLAYRPAIMVPQAIALLSLCFLIFIYGQIYAYHKARDLDIRRQVESGARVLKVDDLIYSDYIHGDKEKLDLYYKYIYQLDYKLEIEEQSKIGESVN